MGRRKFGDMVNGNIAAQVFEKLERSKQYALRYTALNSRKAEGMLQIIRSENEF